MKRFRDGVDRFKAYYSKKYTAKQGDVAEIIWQRVYRDFKIAQFLTYTIFDSCKETKDVIKLLKKEGRKVVLPDSLRRRCDRTLVELDFLLHQQMRKRHAGKA